jgi:ABC-type transport system involved in multi-copper enzyme maturation permease subunit
MRKKLSHYWHAINTLQDRASRSRLWHIGFFLSVAAAFLAASLLLINTFQFATVNIVLVERQILSVPVLVISLVISLYLALGAAASVSREYDNGTLEMLMYGPVDELAFFAGNFWAHFKLFLGALAVTFIWANLIVWLFNLSFNLNVLLLMLAGVLMAVELIAFGLLSAVVGGRTRNALVVFVLALVFLAGIQVGDSIVTDLVTVGGATANDPLLFLRDILAFLNRIFRWISPYAQVQTAFQAVLDRAWAEFALTLGLMFLEGAVLFFLGVRILSRKGVRTTS